MSTKESINKLVKSITGEESNAQRITEGLKDFIKALDGGDKIKPTDDTISELVGVIAEVLPEKIGGGDIPVNEVYDISEGTLTKGNITLAGDVTAHIPDGVTVISNTAFYNNPLITKVVMPNSVITIADGAPWTGGGAFMNARSLKTVIFSNALLSIGNFAFQGCVSLTSITIPDSVTSIGNNAFNDCTSLTSITIPDSVTSIGSGAFNGCTGLTDIYYTGTQTEWEAIEGIADAQIPEGATIHYEYTP